MTTQKSFITRDRAALSLSNIRGPVSLRTGPDDEITVMATLRPETGNIDRTRVEMRQEWRGRVRVETRFDKKGLSRTGRDRQKPCEVEYQVQVPRRCDVSICVVSSETTLEGLAGTFELNTVSGGALLTQMEGRFRLSSISGDLTLAGLTGNLNFETVSGDLRLERCRLSTLKGTSVSGDVHLKLEDKPESVALNTISGDVSLWSSAKSSLKLVLTSISGKILAGSSYNTSPKTGGRQTATLGAGGLTISLNSLSGNLIAYNPNTFTGEPHTLADEADPGSADAMAILESVERGEITFGEGLEAIEG